MRLELYAPILLLVLTVVICLGLGFLFLYRTWRAINKFHRAQGVIVDLCVRSADEVGDYSPVIRFTAPDGREIEFIHTRSHEGPGFKVGQQVTVLHHPKKFNQARLLTDNRNMYYWPVFLLGLGSIFLLMGLLLGAVFGALYLSGAMEKD